MPTMINTKRRVVNFEASKLKLQSEKLKKYFGRSKQMSNMTTARKQRLEFFITALSTRFPHCFSLENPKPLVIEIHNIIHPSKTART